MDDETREAFLLLLQKSLETVDVHEMTQDHAQALGAHLGKLAWTLTIHAGKSVEEILDDMEVLASDSKN